MSDPEDERPIKREGIPYSVAEARLACARNQMDEYHRGLMLFLIARVVELEQAAEGP